MNGTQALGLPWPSLLAFLRLAVNPRIHEFPPPLADAWADSNYRVDGGRT